MTLVVRDEEDVLRENLDYHLRRGVDHVLVTDHASQDATPEILDEYVRMGVAQVFREEAAGSDQRAWVTRMARLAATEHRADWVINSDADEFWWPLAGTLEDMLGAVPEGFGALAVPARNFVPREGTDPFWKRMVVREARSRNLIGDPLEPKAAHRGRPDIEVDHGNHWVAAPGLRTAPQLPLLEILHYPIRSYEQFERKVVNHGLGYEALEDRAPDVGRDQLMLLEVYRRGELPQHYTGLVPNDAEIEATLADGRLVVDRRLEQFLSRLASEAEAASAAPTPDAVATAELGREALTAAERTDAISAVLEDTRRKLDEARVEVERLRAELDEARVSLELLRNSRVVRATRPARVLYHRLRRR